ncbi:hypothetical protein BG261_00935 [Floricoccus tropicus]|uniref:MORN repeat protein n=1 Tax=Floricoccus tropicus TaxID=1859473 RepID=A0A1E8GQG1_9LACT|nr:hypothetical protein [Floricoccus tropicus]OFI50475.1 hypothetical protein BG261_00935 [Floricoccus tropicus]
MSDDLREKLAQIQEEALNKRSKETKDSVDWAEISFKKDENEFKFQSMSESFVENKDLNTDSEFLESDNILKQADNHINNQDVNEQDEDENLITQTESAQEYISKNKSTKSNFYTNIFMGISAALMIVFAIISLDIFSIGNSDKKIKNDDFTYEGKIKNGTYNGPAKITFKNGNILNANFTGGRLDGKFNFIDASSKTKVDGEIDNHIKADIVLPTNQKISYSNEKYKSKSENYSYNGGWDIHGLTYKGTLTFANDAKYKGEFSLGIPNGHGEYSAVDGQVLKGNFVNGVLTDEEK